MSMVMHDKTLMLLHPLDEMHIVDNTIKKSIRYEYGKIQIKKSLGLSVVFVFRAVSTYKNYDIITNTMIAGDMKSI